ncbi:hypothetical protein D9758_014961 [Tetrapyrgos nigripes]|uniref:Pheromone receptor n=1 Tax=Tetrapyrgos nigripes TaxID=182062 RepID=A0A8H5FNI8_9AGAR|nr:hypothetical protein D9758_014961 [Tetrapyrgos nigripes]
MVSKDPTYPLFPIFAFLGFILSLVPLPWHLQAWNSGTCAFMLWTAAACLVTFVNSVVWHNSLLNVAPVWCDISTQVVLGAGVGLPASVLCISRRLYKITSVQTVAITRDDKRRAIYIDLAIALGIPVLVLLLHIVVQPHRFDILEGVGCVPVTYNTLPAYFLFYMWPILLGLVSLGFSTMTLRSFYLRRLQFAQISRSNSALNPSRYFRLMLLAMIDILCTIPLGIYTIFGLLRGLDLAPWISWADTHFDFGHVGLYPALIWRNNKNLVTAIETNRWLPVACALAFFVIFGFAEEAMKNYRRAFWFLAKPLGFTPEKKKISIPSSVSVSTPLFSSSWLIYLSLLSSFKPENRKPKNNADAKDPKDSTDAFPTFARGKTSTSSDDTARKGKGKDGKGSSLRPAIGLNTFMEKHKDFVVPATITSGSMSHDSSPTSASPSSSAPPAYTPGPGDYAHGRNHADEKHSRPASRSSFASMAVSETLAGSPSSHTGSFLFVNLPDSPRYDTPRLPDEAYQGHQQHGSSAYERSHTPDTPYTPNPYSYTDSIYSMTSNVSATSWASHHGHHQHHDEGERHSRHTFGTTSDHEDPHHISISDAYPASEIPSPSSRVSRLPSVIVIGKPDVDVDDEDEEGSDYGSDTDVDLEKGQHGHGVYSHTYTQGSGSASASTSLPSMSVYHSATASASTLTPVNGTTRAPTPMPPMSSMHSVHPVPSSSTLSSTSSSSSSSTSKLRQMNQRLFGSSPSPGQHAGHAPSGSVSGTPIQIMVQVQTRTDRMSHGGTITSE